MKKILISFLILVFTLLYFLISKNTLNKKTLVTIHTQQKQFGHLIDKVILKNFKDLKQHPQIVKSLTSLYPKIILNRFWVDKLEVKQGDFYKFSSWIRFHKQKKFFAKTQPKEWTFSSSSQKHHLSGRLEVAANGVSFFDAYAYCQANNGRLPTQNEFFAIAQGKSSSLYPWGNQFNKSPWAYQEAHLNVSIKGNTFKQNNTKENVGDVGSLVSEWTMGNYPQGMPFIQGGNAYSKPYELYALSSIFHPTKPDYRSYFVGFRCVYDKKPAKKSPWKSAMKTVLIKGGQYQFNQFKYSKLLPLLKQFKTLNLKTINSYYKKAKRTSFQVMNSEVSVAQYQKFLNDPLVKYKIDANTNEPKNHSDIPANWKEQLTDISRPVVGVDWWSAYHFSQWFGGRLPSEQDFLSMQLHFSHQGNITKEEKLGRPASLKNNQHYLFDNVSEWTGTIDTNQENTKMIVKGGSFMTKKTQSKNFTFFRSISPHHKDRDIGFRVVF